MNFLDAYDVSSTPTPREGQDPTLNEEVTQVVGQLSRFWGGFRKQSQAALETARKDFTQVVSQAQKELTKLTTDSTTAAPASEPQAGTSSNRASTDQVRGEASSEADSEVSEKEAPETESGPSSPTTPTATQPSRHNRVASVSSAAQNLFSRLQSSLPSNLAQTVQAQIPASIKQGASSIDFAQLRTNLASEFQRVQGITRAQAEEYVHKSEELLKEAGEFLKDAVKVVPPEEGAAGSSGVPAGVMWDGSDIWMLPDVGTSTSGAVEKGKGKERESQEGRASTEGLRAVATRAEALLKQLRHDPNIIKVDPQADERVAPMWDDWLKKEVEEKEDGIQGEHWRLAIQKALEDPVDGSALQKTMDTLVPSDMTSDTFWSRYFFRVYQVEQEEERRKALLQGKRTSSLSRPSSYNVHSFRCHGK